MHHNVGHTNSENASNRALPVSLPYLNNNDECGPMVSWHFWVRNPVCSHRKADDVRICHSMGSKKAESLTLSEGCLIRWGHAYISTKTSETRWFTLVQVWFWLGSSGALRLC